MHFDHIIRCIVNANHSVVRPAVEFGVADRNPDRVLFANRRWFSTIGRAAKFKLQHSTTTTYHAALNRRDWFLCRHVASKKLSGACNARGPLDVQQSVCSIEQSCVRTPSRGTGTTHYADT
jgi:hypothetical protein